MKKHISIILLLVLVLSNTIAFAAPGDIIHTGLKKVYRKTVDDNLLVEDVLNPNVDKNGFYREIEVGGDVKFVNITDEENAHEKWIIENMPKDLNLTDEDAVREYILSQVGELERITKEIAKDFDESWAGMTWEEYQGYHNAPKLKAQDNYSIPEPGFKEGSTKIARLKLPTDANKWQIQISDNEIPAMKKSTLLKNGKDYVNGRDIDIDVGKYLVLYAVDRDNKIKAFENIKITENMINTPKELASQMKSGKISEGEKYAGSVVINELNELPEGAAKWQVFLSPIPMEKVYKVKMADAIDYNAGDDIVVAKENELHPIVNSFKKYLVLLAVDNEGVVQGYNTFEIGKNDISKAPSLLIENTHYMGPVPGDENGHTKFTELHFGINPDENMKDATSWKVLLSENPIPVPKLDLDSGTRGTVLSVPNEIEASIGDYLLLVAVDNYDKIKGYRIFHLAENMVKGETAPKLEEGSNKNYSPPSKGTVQGTTKIDRLNPTGIVGATKWMYKVGEDLANPIFNKIVEGSSDYIAGQNVRANSGEDFLLLATDNEGRVKAFAKIKLDDDMIKDPPPVLLKEGVNYVGPVKGNSPGTTKFDALSGSASIGENPKWMYVISNEMPEIPELDKEVEGAKELEPKDSSIGVNLSSDKYLMLLATDNGKVKGYAIFRLGEYNIKMPSAPELTENNYSNPEKGTAPGTTRITELEFTGIENAGQWRYKVSRETFLKSGKEIEFNTTIPQTTVYNKGNNIRAEAGDYLLLLATDGSGRIKGYKQFELGEDQVTKPNAPLLLPRTNYTEPEAGSEKNTTKFGFLDVSTNIKGADEWRYVIGDKPFGNIELDSVIEDTIVFEAKKNIEGVSEGTYLLLLATDNSGKVKGYREFRLTDRNIRGGPAKELKLNENYVLERGNKPGTTKFTKLIPLGMEGNTSWKYKLMDSELPSNGKPYLNSVTGDTNFINIGQDIEVKKIEDNYGYLLLIAVDGSGRTKGYAEIEIDPNKVKEHAPLWKVALGKGSAVDSVKVTGDQPLDTTAKYIRGYRPFPTPAVDEILQNGIEYNLEGDIAQIRIGEHLGIYAVDKDNRIKAFNSLEVTQDKIKQSKATITAPTLLEGNINNGGGKIIIELSEGAKWASDLKTNADKRQALYNGFKANSESQEWAKVVASLVKDGSGAISLSDDNTELTISLSETRDYDITKDQEITLTVPAIAIERATNPIDASGEITIKPTVKAIISGDVVNSIVREDDIKAGGKTIVVELKDGDWAEDVISIVKGFSGGKNWSKIAAKIGDKNIVRNSSKKLTITLPEVSDVNFEVNKEIVSLTIPKELVQGTETDVVATPTFTLYPRVLQVSGKATDKDTVYLEAPDGRVPLKDKDIWEIEVDTSTGTLKDNITDKDIVVSGFPRGLKANVVEVDNGIITIKVSGTAAAKIDNMEVKVKVKGSVIEEPNSLDSEDIMLNLKMNEPKTLDHVKYRLQHDGDKFNVYLVGADNDMEYSIDSTNGINGEWDDASLGEFLISEASPMKIWVREKAQSKVFRQVGELKYGDMPVDVKINYYNYDSSGLEITLDGNIQDMQYSIDGGSTWQDLNSSTIPVKLDSNSDLRIRSKAITGTDQGANLKLPSLPTKKLNGIYLGNVELNVAEGRIENTTTNMEYSTDGNKFTSARNGNTPVNFIKGTTISIRERGRDNSINFRELGLVKQMEFSQTELGSIGYDISTETIIDGAGYEYKIANDPWKDVDLGTEIAFKPGSLQFRKKGDKENLPSEAREKAIITPQAPAPNLSYDDVNHTIEKIGTDDGSIYEYSINNEVWTIGSTDPEFMAGQEVRIRIKADDKTLPSQIQTIRFTPNLPFDNVYLDAGKSMIMNTTAEMEYSLNSTDGLNGQWYKASSPNTNIPLKKGMVVYIREAKKPINKKNLTKDANEKDLDEKIIKNHIGFSIVNQTISIDTSGKVISDLQKIVDDLQYRIADNTWINIPYTKLEPDKINILAYNVDFKPGKLEFRLRGDQNDLPSKPVEKTIIKASVSAPNVEVDYINEKVTSINDINTNKSWDIFEYNIDNGPWINGEYLKTEDLSGEKTLNIRTKATGNELPSQEAVIKLKKKLPLEHVTLSTHVKPLELNGTTTQMEYRVNNIETWKECDNGNTKLTRRDGSDLNDLKDVFIIEIRDSEQHENSLKIYG